MLIKKFRNVDFINREREIEFFKSYLKTEPERILWVYGLKSAGKTTLIEYIIEKELIKDFKLFKSSQYWIKYINFRRTIVVSYNNFIESFFEEVEDNEEDDFSGGEIESEVNLGVIKVRSRLLNQIRQNKKNLFNQLILNLKKIKKKKIIVMDEIQCLHDIYFNGERLLLNEFLNFCVALTKELHLAHIIILTSNTIFLEQIYSDSRLKKTSDFKLISHLDYRDIKQWLKEKNYDEDEIKLIYEYLGGCVSDIKKLIDNNKIFDSLKDYLENEVNIAKNEIKIYIEQIKLSEEEIKKFYFVINEIIKNGYFNNDKFIGYLDIIFRFAEKEILFFDPVYNVTTVNSRIYIKAFERIVNSNKMEANQ